MKMMRDFVTDERLHRALDEVESWFGYEIGAIPTPDYYRDRACCSMHLNKSTQLFELWYIPEEPQMQSTYCHELAHAILWINGAVTRYDFIDPIHPVLYTPPIRHFSGQIWEYMQHVPLFTLVKELGYDETPYYAPITEHAIALIRQKQLFSAMDVHSVDPLKDQLRCQASFLVQFLSLPMAEGKRDALRNTAWEMLPKSFGLADAMLAALGTRSLLGQQEYLEYLLEIFHIAELPIGNLRFSFLDRICPNFRSRILEAAMI